MIHEKDREKIIINYSLLSTPCPQMTQTVKNLPAMQETLVQSLGEVDPPEKGMTTHSNILAWRIPWTEERKKKKKTVLTKGQDYLLILKNLVALCLFVEGGKGARRTAKDEQ